MSRSWQGAARPGRAPRAGSCQQPRTDADAGTILILTLGYVMIALMLALVVTDASAVYLARRSVASAADGAALAAAQHVDDAAIYTATEDFRQLPLSEVTAAVAGYQADADPSGHTVLTAQLLNAATVRVTGTRTVVLPVVALLGIGPVTVTASADAQSLVRPPGA